MGMSHVVFIDYPAAVVVKEIYMQTLWSGLAELKERHNPTFSDTHMRTVTQKPDSESAALFVSFS